MAIRQRVWRVVVSVTDTPAYNEKCMTKKQLEGALKKLQLIEAFHDLKIEVGYVEVKL